MARLQWAVCARGVLQVALEVGLQAPARARPALRARRDSGCRLLVLGQRGVQQFAGAPELPGRQPRRAGTAPLQALEGVPQRRVGERALRERLGVGVEVAPGGASARTNQRTGQPIQLSSEDADQTCSRSRAEQDRLARSGARAAGGAAWRGAGGDIVEPHRAPARRR